MARFGIGQAVRRVEDERFLKGAGNYVGDIALPGELCGVVVYSSEAHAKVKRVEKVRIEAVVNQGELVELSRPRILYEAELHKGEMRAEVEVAKDGTLLQPPRWRKAEVGDEDDDHDEDGEDD